LDKQKKGRWVLRDRKTNSVELFRTTPPKTVCPNFYVLAHANGCGFSPGCSYCFLKSSFWHLDAPHVFTNVDKMCDDIRAWIAEDNLESYVLNSGNLSDSLSFEAVRPAMTRLVELFRTEAEAKSRPHTLLLVTKGGIRHCAPLFDIAPSKNVIVSFSVNSPEAAADHEKGCARVQDRLDAARRLKSQDWRIRMRIDPMIHGYDYSWITEQVKSLAPERVTLGSLRAEPNLLKAVGNGIFKDLTEQFPKGGMSRYPAEKRLALYRPAVASLRSTCPVALCEEALEVWQALSLDTDSKPCNCGS
jgi:DNA repair photolyase